MMLDECSHICSSSLKLRMQTPDTSEVENCACFFFFFAQGYEPLKQVFIPMRYRHENIIFLLRTDSQKLKDLGFKSHAN